MTDSSPFTPAPPFEKSHTQIPDLSKDYINEKKKEEKSRLLRYGWCKLQNPCTNTKKHEKSSITLPTMLKDFSHLAHINHYTWTAHTVCANSLFLRAAEQREKQL